MRTDMIPPGGSAITMTESSEGFRYSWSAGTAGGVANVGMTVFLMFWLVGWAVGETFAFRMLRSGEAPGGANLFLLAWLGAWTIGGLGCMWTIFLNLRPLRPAVLLVGRNELEYETGTRRPDLKSNDRRTTDFKKMFGGTRNRVHRIPVREASNLVLARVGERLRLSLDHQSRRIEIGESLGEPDKEWLHTMLVGIIPAP